MFAGAVIIGGLGLIEKGYEEYRESRREAREENNDKLALKKAQLDNTLDAIKTNYDFQNNSFEQIKALIEIRKELEGRIISIMSDYTQMINQVALVSTLTLGMSVGAFGSLLGNTDDQSEWKIVLFAISCVVTICCSVMSVIESFFLAIHINQVEARFAGGVYPHIKERDNARFFDADEMRNINSKFNFIIVTFFLSFLSFASTILSTVYLGLGLSQNVFLSDTRLFKHGDTFFKNTTSEYTPLSDHEPGFVPAASTLSIIVICTYVFIMYRFLTTYSRQIHAYALMRFFLMFGCINPNNRMAPTQDSNNTHVTHNIAVPIIHAAKRFNSIQEVVSKEVKQWIKHTQLLLLFINGAAKDGENEVLISSRGERLTIPYMQTPFTMGLTNLNTNDLEKSIENNIDYIVNESGMGEVFSKIGSIIDVGITIMAKTLFKSYNDKWHLNRYTTRITTCVHYAKLLKKNLSILKQYTNAEQGYVSTPFNLQRKPCSRFMATLLVLWSITGGLVIILISIIVALLWHFVTCGDCFCCVDRIKWSWSIAMWHVNHIDQGFKWISSISRTYDLYEIVEFYYPLDFENDGYKTWVLGKVIQKQYSPIYKKFEYRIDTRVASKWNPDGSRTPIATTLNMRKHNHSVIDDNEVQNVGDVGDEGDEGGAGYYLFNNKLRF